MIIKTNKINFKINKENHLKIKPNFFVDTQYPELEDLEITPSTEEQKFKSNKYGYNEVTVKKIAADVDEDIKPENIKAGINILDVEGTFEGIDTSDATVTPDDILEGKTAYANNKQITGTIQEYDGSFSGDVAEIEENVIMDDSLLPTGLLRDRTNALKAMITKISLQELNTSNWDSTEALFSYCENLTNIPQLNTSNSTNMSNMFNSCKKITTIPQLDTSKVTNMYYMFRYCESLKTIPKMDTSNVTNMGYMFYECKSLETIPEMDTSKVTSMDQIFGTCESLITIPHLNTSNIKTMSSLFKGCVSLKNIPLLDTSNVTSASYMFAQCKSLEAIPLLDTSKMTYMSSMFEECASLVTIPQLDMSNVTSMSSMFKKCYKLTSIPQLNTSKVTSMYDAFSYCESLESIPEIDASSLTDIGSMFYRCKSLMNFGGLKNIGKGFTKKSANGYTLTLADSNNLTHDSLINIINNLYDLNLTYDVANGGTLYTQRLVLGSTNKTKLTPEEIVIATSKGWTVS